MKNYSWAKIIVDTYRDYGVKKGHEYQTYQIYPNKNIEIGSDYGLIIVKKGEYEIVEHNSTWE